jgi:ubiquinone biosynthesis accessory factor UbiJ
MLERAVLPLFNHLLSAEDWALARLKPFAGQSARFDVGALSFGFCVAPDGSLAISDHIEEPTVTLRLPDDTPMLLLVDRNRLFQSARITGAADFAEALGFVARNLHWDAEADLARFIGDIPAHRLARDLRSFVKSKGDIAERLLANLVEFIADEESVVVRPGALTAFSLETAQLAKDLARLEERTARL